MKEIPKVVISVPETGLVKKSEEVSPAPPTSFTPYFVADSGGSKVHLRDYWRKVRKHLLLVVGAALFGTVLSIIYMARKPDIYEAGARVQVDLENAGASGSTSKTGLVVVNSATSDPAYFNTQLQILKGEALQRRVVKTLDLEHNSGFLRPLSGENASTWQNLLRMMGIGRKEQKTNGPANNVPRELPLTDEVAPMTQRDNLAEAERLAPYVAIIRSGLSIEPVRETSLPNKETRLIEIRYNHPNPQVAAKVANAIADTFTLSNLERKSETNTNTGDFLQKRIAELQAQIRNGEERLINYAKDNQILSLEADQNTVVDRLVGLNKQLLEAENQRKMAESAYRAALLPGAAEAIAEGEAKAKNESAAKLAELEQKRAQLLVEFTEKYPEVKEVDEQIAVLRKQSQTQQARSAEVVKLNLETNYRQAFEREKSLRAAFDQQRGETLAQNAAAINYRIIQQEIETNKSLLSGLLQQSKENDVVLAGRPNNIFVAEYATTPVVPVSPRRWLSVMVALMLSLTFGVCLAIFLEYLDDTVSSVEDVETGLRLPSLAVIPHIGRGARRFLPIMGRGTRYESDGDELLLNAGPRSALAEAYRHLRTSVLLATAGRQPKTLLVTSSLPSEGKTTTTINLALTLAQTGASVLIIDADMRRPRMHEVFNISGCVGLSTILSRDLTREEILMLVEKHEETGVHILPAGVIPPNPAELLGSEQMRDLLKTLESVFTFIVIDSPPIASCTDGVLLSTLIDGVVLVVQGGKSPMDVANRSREFIEGVRGKIFGVVLNNVKTRDNKYYRFYHDYYRENASKPFATASTLLDR